MAELGPSIIAGGPSGPTARQLLGQYRLLRRGVFAAAVAVLAASCSEAPPPAWSGYVEGEYV